MPVNKPVGSVAPPTGLRLVYAPSAKPKQEQNILRFLVTASLLLRAKLVYFLMYFVSKFFHLLAVPVTPCFKLMHVLVCFTFYLC